MKFYLVSAGKKAFPIDFDELCMTIRKISVAIVDEFKCEALIVQGNHDNGYDKE